MADDTWLEAELARELEELGDVSEDELEVDGDGIGSLYHIPRDAWANLDEEFSQHGSNSALEKADAHNGGSLLEQEEAAQAADEEATPMPESFKELMQALQDLECEAAKDTGEAAVEAKEVVDEIERKLREQAAKPAWTSSEEGDASGLPGVGTSLRGEERSEVDGEQDMGIESAESEAETPEQDLVGGMYEDYEDDEDANAEAKEEEARLEQERKELEEAEAALLRARQELEEEKERQTHESVPPPEVPKNDQDSQKDIGTNEAAPLDTAAQELVPDEEVALPKEVEEEQRKFEEDRLAQLAELERVQKELQERIRREEAEEAAEAERRREEFAMNSEEIRLRDFYYAERSAQHRERRGFGYEDRRSWQVREERLQAEKDEEKGRQALEGDRMQREDEAARRIRSMINEAREQQRMLVEDELSNRFRVEMQRLSEVARMEEADRCAWRWREALREQDEVRRMTAAEAESEMMRQCAEPTRSSKKVRQPGGTVGLQALAARASSSAVSVAKELSPEAALAGLVAAAPKRKTGPEGPLWSRDAPEQLLPPGRKPGLPPEARGSFWSAGRAQPQDSVGNPSAAQLQAAKAATDAGSGRLVAAAAGPFYAAGVGDAVSASESLSREARFAERLYDPAHDPLRSQAVLEIETLGLRPEAPMPAGKGLVLTEPSTRSKLKPGARSGGGAAASGGCQAVNSSAAAPEQDAETMTTGMAVPSCSSSLCEALRAGAVSWRSSSSPTAWRRVPEPRRQIQVDPPTPSTASSARGPSADTGKSDGKALTQCDEEDDALLPDLSELDEALYMANAGAAVGKRSGGGSKMTRLEMKMEGLQSVPNLQRYPDLRVLSLTGNKLKDLEPLRHCPLLEDLAVGQNQLTSLRDLRHSERLTTLKAAQNLLEDTKGIVDLRHLRDVELSGNRLKEVSLRSPCLARLELYKNALTSMAFLEHLPSLTHLDLRMNKLTALDARICDWNPLLQKVYVYENRISSLPELRLPLLTDLYIDNNCLEALGPLGFLPSLERLGAKSNKIAQLSLPIAASPLLQSLELGDNKLDKLDLLRPAFLYPRLRKLQLSDNPAIADLMEKYRPWVLQRAPHLEELDNETVSSEERAAAVLHQALNDPGLAYDLQVHGIIPGVRQIAVSQQDRDNTEPKTAKPMAPHKPSRRRQARGAPGLLGLTMPSSLNASMGDEFDGLQSPSGVQARPLAACASPVCEPPGSSHAFEARDAAEVRRSALLGRWFAKADSNAAGDFSHGCDMCAMAGFCEAATAARDVLLVAHRRDERRIAASHPTSIRGDGGRGEVLFNLQRRRDFWASYVETSGAQLDVLAAWGRQMPGNTVCRVTAFEAVGTERSKHRLAQKLQSLWRRRRAKRHAQQLRLQKRCESMSETHVLQITTLQAKWRGDKARKVLLAEVGIARMPGARRRRQAVQATVRLQAAIRGWLARRKIRWARSMCKMADAGLDDCPEIDVDALLGDIAGIDSADPFTLQVPDARRQTTLGSTASAAPAMMSARQSRRQGAGAAPGLPAHAGRNATTTGSAAAQAAGPTVPLMAWNTPPGTAEVPAAGTLLPQQLETGSMASSAAPSPSMSGGGGSRPGSSRHPRRCRSLSSTAESAVTENPANPDACAPRREQWAACDDPDAEAYMAARARIKGRPKPPKIPGAGSGNAGNFKGVGANHAAMLREKARASGPAGPLSGGGGPRSTHSQPPGRGGLGISQAGSQPRLVKAQDAIAEARRLQAEAAAASAGPAAAWSGGAVPGAWTSAGASNGFHRFPSSSPEAPPREFQSGEANRLLMRTSGNFSGRLSPQTPPGRSGSSPRASSPYRR
eukprot:TRINITY_DN9146_c0_g2_i2.p1 TRINITY_DN9146_c0_g2~~TRINITY_DN9146_c0_g2_i2.p1  ORF type:complete len:1824 (+),score=505.27 TRINITY_DN9146_c0_g2_i2:231-5702(+)